MQRIHVHHSLVRITRISLALVMLALALMATARPAAAASISATRTGSGFQISGLGKEYLFYGLKQPYRNSYGRLAWPSGSNDQYVFGTGSTIFVGGLRPNTTYYWMVGDSFGTLGTTLQRRVDVSFNSITVTNDSDSSGAGELYYFFKVNGVLHSELNFYRSTSATVTFNPGKSVTGIENGGEYIDLAVELIDDDCTFSTCKPTNPTFTRYGDSGDFEWGTGYGSINFKDIQANFDQRTVKYGANVVMAFEGSALVSVAYF
jgi:hypothetical protein